MMLEGKTGWAQARRQGVPCCQHSQHLQESSARFDTLSEPWQAMPPCAWGQCHQLGALGVENKDAQWMALSACSATGAGLHLLSGAAQLRCDPAAVDGLCQQR